MLYFFHFPVYSETYLFVGSLFPGILEETVTGEFQGVGADIATEIVEGLGHTIKIKSYPWARAQRMIIDGKADALIGPYKTSRRNEFMDYTQYHFYVDRIVFYVKNDSTLIWNGDFLSLKGHVIGTTIGWSYGHAFDQVKNSLTIESVKDLCTNFKKLVIGRVAIVPATYRNALACIKQFNL
jgi:polar amino acid transport system substrate-binding protein